MTKVVKVNWIDSQSDNGRWTLRENIDLSPVECVTFGFLVEENDKFITVAQTIGKEPEQYCQMICIPVESITHFCVIEDHSPQDSSAVDPNDPNRVYIKAENVT